MFFNTAYFTHGLGIKTLLLTVNQYSILENVCIITDNLPYDVFFFLEVIISARYLIIFNKIYNSSKIEIKNILF
ncbi:hypothetical protein [Candidatus Karelsulcia muelleri]|uniref:hypothetical protein n=1 Tax=Candidatus Karelsulcia muelleri TaxID=336810 RepID=UPI0013A67F02|nr:hypothetical protein [Candidatus Karelsulcia muelleri]